MLGKYLTRIFFAFFVFFAINVITNVAAAPAPKANASDDEEGIFCTTCPQAKSRILDIITETEAETEGYRSGKGDFLQK